MDEQQAGGRGEEPAGENDARQDGKPAPQAPSAARLVFGDPLDRQTGDDTDLGWGERPGGSPARGLDWYLSQRPPHHGD
ncbi:hypothetical protein [Kitasatospora sp. NPDC085879]|uniref:hypothetical protein n=1 Tax=Kitasatospora sp. NPDC085879 TaxID=3154769 RepID=UPI00342F17FB